MDLATLVAACAMVVDPKVMHALVWHQSGGEPWAFSVPGQRQPQVLRSVEDAVAAARGTRPGSVAIRVGLAGLPGTPRSVTASMFTPCSNVAAAARQIAQFADLCTASSRANGDPMYCAVAAYHGSWDLPDHRFADAVGATVARGDAPDFEMPAAARAGMEDVVSRPPPGTVPSPSPAPDDVDRARESPLFPVMASSDRPPDDRPDNGRSAAGQHSTDGPTLRGTNPPPAGGMFVPRPAQSSRSE